MDFKNIHPKKLLGTAFVGVLLLIGIFKVIGRVGFHNNSSLRKGSTENTEKTTNKPEASEDMKFSTTTREAAISHNLYQDNETLQDILHNENFLEQMKLWNGKALFVQSNQDQSELHYYYYSSLYRDTNQNSIQDARDEGVFNPASTVKVGLAALVLEQLSKIDINRQAEYRVLGSQDWYSFEEDIRRTLVISDNESTNRLILWLGFDRINYGFKDKGLNYLEINRLMLDRGTLIQSPPFEVRLGENVIQQEAMRATVIPACYEVDNKVGNCSTANDLIEGLIRLIQPSYFDEDNGFEISQSDREWMQEVMSHKPRQEGFDYADNYCRFLTNIEQRFASESGKMLSKCGVSLFTNTYTDLSYLKTDLGQEYYILLSVSPPISVSEEETILWMNLIAETILEELPEF